MPRRDRFTESDVSVERYEDRRDYVSRGGRGRGGEERYYEEDIEYRSRGPPPREREKDREIIIKEREDVRYRDVPEILRDDYGRSSAGPLVLRKRETEDFEYAPRSRRRTPSPELEQKISREEIIIRRNSPSPERLPPRREKEVDKEEIIIRRDERSRDRRPPPREVETDREEVIIRRDERDRRGLVYDDVQREEVIIRRDDDRHDRRPPPPRDYDREEIIIRRDEREDDRLSRVTTRGRDDYVLARPISHERERSRVDRGSIEHEHDDEIIIRRDEREGGRGGDRQREEIIIRKHSRSPSPDSSYRAPPPLEAAPIYAPPIHREIIYHERHIDHGYETALARIPSRAPSPPMPAPPPPRERSEERIEIRRTGERNGRAYDEDIIIDRNEGPRPGRRVPEPEPAPARGPYREEIDIIRDDRGPRGVREEIDIIRDDRGPRGVREEVDIIREERGPRGYRRDETDIQEEADYYNQRAVERSYIGEGLHGATRDWAIVDVPPGTQRVRMDGVGGGSQEISWQRYNGVRRSKFMPDGSPSDEGYGSEVGRPLAGAGPATIGPRYGPRRKEGEGLWTEITKDLVVKEAITQAGYEFEETDDFYYIMSYLKYVSWFPFTTLICEVGGVFI